MQTRKEASSGKKFEVIPPDFCALTEKTILETFAALLRNHSVKISGRIYPEEIVVRLSIFEGDSIRPENISVSLDHDMEKENAMEQIHLGIDVIASALQESMGEEDMEKPLDWHAFEVEGQDVFIMFDRIHDDLEKQADELLGDSEENIDEEEIGADFFNQKNTKH
tara:strand:- start:1534 stop:2031 length:498 start_codon:yes stop_codon:yes gene_type:complete